MHVFDESEMPSQFCHLLAIFIGNLKVLVLVGKFMKLHGEERLE
jgi:hypothetical protein